MAALLGRKYIWQPTQDAIAAQESAVIQQVKMIDPIKKGEAIQHHEHVYDAQHAGQVVDRRQGLKDSLATTLGPNRPDPWGKGHKKLYVACFFIYLLATMNGYDGSLMGSINAMQSYLRYYNLPLNGSTSTGLVFSIFQIAQMCAAVFVPLSDYIGRRKTIMIGGVGVILGTIVTATAKDLPTFIGGRFLLAFFATLATTAAPLLLVEIAPPLHRGLVSGVYNCQYYLGSIIATFTTYGTDLHLADKTIAFRLPLWLQMVLPAIACIGVVLIVPESPKWLYAKGRHEQVRDFYVLYHANGDTSHPIVDLELDELAESLRHEGMTRFRDLLDLRVFLKTRARRYRTGICIAMSWFGQFSGNNIASYYLPIFLNQVGVTSTTTQLLLNAIYAIIGLIFATTGAYLHDVVGRRKMLMGSTLGMSICLGIVTGTAAGAVDHDNVAAGKASIFGIFLFGAVFAISFTSMQPIYPAEVLSNDQRGKGMALFQLVSGAAGFCNTFAAPTALAKAGYWVYFFFTMWDLFEFAIIWLFFVETAGRTLEEMDAIFAAKNPVKASLRKVSVVEVADPETGRVVPEIELDDEATLRH